MLVMKCRSADPSWKQQPRLSPRRLRCSRFCTFRGLAGIEGQRPQGPQLKSADRQVEAKAKLGKYNSLWRGRAPLFLRDSLLQYSQFTNAIGGFSARVKER